jgi:acetylornithine deacetylase/succinyl-diaminopimelate desuccinylase-like protein
MAKKTGKAVERQKAGTGSVRQRLVKAVSKSRVAELTEKLVNIPSPTGGEAEIADFLAKEFEKIGLEVKLQEIEAGRNNVIARLPGKGRGRGRNLMFCAHFDTSATDADKIPGQQSRAVREGDWINGLGASNMKNAFAGYIGAVEALMETGAELNGDILITGVVGEIEKAPVSHYQGIDYRGGGSGARFMMSHGVVADLAIIGEPTGMRIQLGNTGYIFARITTQGIGQHTFSKDKGVDAIEKMVKIRDGLKAWETEYRVRHPHPFMLVSVGISAIEGGLPFKPSFCPAPFCHLYIHITTLPGTTPVRVRDELLEFLDRLERKDPELHAEVDFYMVSNGYETSPDHELVKTVHRIHKEVFNKDPLYPEPARYSVSSDGGIMSEYGTVSITYGAGGITPSGVYSMYDGAKGECLSIVNLSNIAKAYALAAYDLCG